MKKVYIIGNNANNNQVSDGGRIKIRLYKELLQKVGFECFIIELDGWKKHIFKTLKQIKQAVNDDSVILIMAGPKGCRFIIPIVNRYNKKHEARVVFCPLGIGTFDYVIKSLNINQVSDFINGKDYFELKDEKMRKNLKKLDLIIPQNQVLVDLYTKFYSLNNVQLLPNFRNAELKTKQYNPLKKELTLIYASRICENKGVFDLLNAVKDLNDNNYDIRLDIFGDMQLSKKDRNEFNSYLNDNIQYKGVLRQDETIGEIRKRDLFCLPTKYYAEGTSGALIEAFISGTPALISSYSQSKLLVENRISGFISDIGNVDSIKQQLIYIYNNRDILSKVGVKAQELSKQYLFDFNKETFIECIFGNTKI